jgi:hypothetical protein
MVGLNESEQLQVTREERYSQEGRNKRKRKLTPNNNKTTNT